MYLNYFLTIQQILGGLVVSVVYWVFWIVHSNPTALHSSLFFLSNWRDLHFHEHFQLEISSKCDTKPEDSCTLCKYRQGRKGLRPMVSNADHVEYGPWTKQMLDEESTYVDTGKFKATSVKQIMK